MTKQITVKLNYDLFRPLIDNLRQFSGEGLVASDSDLVAKALFFVYYILKYKDRLNKSRFEILIEHLGLEKTQAIVTFLNEFYYFRSKGLKY